MRREDMKLLLATRGKVFTQQNLHQLVEHTRLVEFRSRQAIEWISDQTGRLLRDSDGETFMRGSKREAKRTRP